MKTYLADIDGLSIRLRAYDEQHARKQLACILCSVDLAARAILECVQ